MKNENQLQALKKLCFDAKIFPEEVLNWIRKENLWNIWVPKDFGGLEVSFSNGLSKLQDLAKIDGSLGWTVTLCSGANFFIGNLEPKTAKEVFQKSGTTILGGSGGTFGKAEKLGDDFKISGTWRYATGAPYLTHFTLNAEIFEKGKALLNEDGSPKVRSFVVPKEKVRVIEDWDTMGLKASVTHSFEVKSAVIPKRFSFVYNDFHQPQDIFKVPFSVFADLTLWVNYVGMAEHFLEEASVIKSIDALETFAENLDLHNQKITRYAEDIELKITSQKTITEDFLEEIHTSASNSVKNISQNIIEIYPYLGIKASRKNHPLNQIFCDYFTATQHHIFTK
ncbi:acyl-CoA dehydrogenase [Salegentibacter sp. Hel_I_6]|uniref:acyl-CoA dehydrogenase n=1 Tax=Salegentibacter sp. Hel_I_6 TaxID=1250278 RepID=UPI00055EAB49|nr:acyl-CoA dehydrogenase [Salegentibacter sp. Hel_I_6]